MCRVLHSLVLHSVERVGHGGLAPSPAAKSASPRKGVRSGATSEALWERGCDRDQSADL